MDGEQAKVRVYLKGIDRVKKRLADGSVATIVLQASVFLIGQPESPEFVASYGDAEKTIEARRGGDVFNLLIRSYTQSVEFQKLAQSTKTEYLRMLTKAETEFGDMPIEALNDSRVRMDFMDWREKVARKSGCREADNRLSAISAMLTWAVERGQVSANHLKGFKRLYHADHSEIIWSEEHVTAFMKVASLEMQRRHEGRWAPAHSASRSG
jgi:hypothetical protein